MTTVPHFPFAAVLFDFDGVLVDTEHIAHGIWLALLAEQGLHFERQAFVDRVTGQTLGNLYAELERDFGFKRTDAFEEEMTRRISAAFAEMPPLPGARQTLELLQKRQVPFAVASNSEHQHLRPKLRLAGLEELFGEHVYDPSYVGGRGKPNPDLYQYTAQQLGQDITRCLVIEDSLPGVRAGAASGAVTWGFSGANHTIGTERLRQAGASDLVASHAELQEKLGLRSGPRQ